MKELYKAIILEIVCFDATDVITDSPSGDTPLPETGEP